MEILIYIVIPCVGSVFLLGGMFYGAYRMSGYAGLPGREDRLLGEDMPRRKDVSRLRDAPGQEGMARRKGISRLRGMAGEKRMSWRESMFRRGLPGRTLGIISAYILVCVAFSSLGNTWVNLFFQFLFPLVAWRAYGTPKIYCLYYLILSVAVWLTDVAAVLTYQVLVAEGALYLNAPQLQYILLVAATRMAEFMVILLVSMAVGRRAGRHITVRQVALSVLLPLYSVFNMYCMLYLVQIFPTKEMLVLLGINLLLLIGLNIYFCVLVDVMSENHRLENERNLYRTQAKMQHQYYQREEEKYEFSRKMIHDIRNHILAMEALYKEENAREAAAYAGDIHRMLNQFQQKYYTSEKLLNIILNDKANTMRRLGIQEDIRVGEISLDFMKETDVTALFANLLDNAVAAAGESKAGFVRVRVNQVRQFLSVTVENSCDREPEKETGIGGTFRSRRPGHEGMGLKIVQRTVEQYGGDVQYSWEDGVFTAHVMLIGL